MYEKSISSFRIGLWPYGVWIGLRQEWGGETLENFKIGEESPIKELKVSNPFNEPASVNESVARDSWKYVDTTLKPGDCLQDYVGWNSKAPANYSCTLKYTVNPKIFARFSLPQKTEAVKADKVDNPAPEDKRSAISVLKFVASPDGASLPPADIVYTFPKEGGEITKNININPDADTTYELGNIGWSLFIPMPMPFITCDADEACYIITDSGACKVDTKIPFTITVPKAGCDIKIKAQGYEETPTSLYLIPQDDEKKAAQRLLLTR